MALTRSILRVDALAILVTGIADHAVVAVDVTNGVTRSILRFDALTISVVGIADHAVVTIGVAHCSGRSILLSELVRHIRKVEARLGAYHCET